MKKVGLITYHKSYNYGAMLQVYATQYIIKKMGYDCKIIDYVNKDEEKENKLFFYKRNFTFMHNVKYLLRNIFLKSYFIRNNNFKNFINKLDRTKKVTNCTEISQLRFDTYIVGSDQVWNPLITGNKFEPAYLLDFNAKKKISFASSMGSHKLNSSEMIYIKDKLSNFNAISVREKFAKEQLNELGINCKIVCDPTLLIDKNDWINNCYDDSILNGIPKNYIILYLLEPFSDKISEILLKVKSVYNLPVVYIAFSNSKKKNVDYHLTNVTPERFVCLINNSDLVLTDSFHGTAFSVNLNKQFISILNPSNPKRVEDFLTFLGLEENIYNKKIKKNFIDYKKINSKIESIINDSIKFLKQNL